MYTGAGSPPSPPLLGPLHPDHHKALESAVPLSCLRGRRPSMNRFTDLPGEPTGGPHWPAPVPQAHGLGLGTHLPYARWLHPQNRGTAWLNEGCQAPPPSPAHREPHLCKELADAAHCPAPKSLSKRMGAPSEGWLGKGKGAAGSPWPHRGAAAK